MLTPIEIQSKTFKTGFGYDKKEVEAFIKDVVRDYEVYYKENMELHDKINVLSEGVQYYKSIEKTLQKALVLAQKAAQETEANATQKAENIVTTATNKATSIEDEAEKKARQIKETAKEQADALLMKARQELEQIQLDVANLIQQYDKYKIQYKSLINTQMEILESPAYNVDYSNFLTFHSFISSKLEMPKEEEETVEEAAQTPEETKTQEIDVEVDETPVVEEKVEEPVEEAKEEVHEEMENDFIPELDLDGVLDDTGYEEEPINTEVPETVVTDNTMKELTAEKAEEVSNEENTIDQTINQLSEKELLMKLFASANESGSKGHKSKKNDDFEFLDL